jgi:hypothetical protein
LKSELVGTFGPYENLTSKQEITFDLLWTIFRLQTIVFSMLSGFGRAYEVKAIEHRSGMTDPYWKIEVKELD